MCFSYLYSFLLHVISYNLTPPHFRSSYVAVSTYFHLPWCHYYIFFSFSLHKESTWPDDLSLASLIFSLKFATPAIALISYFFIPYLLDTLHSNHPSQHSRFCSFYQVLLSLSQSLGLTSIHYNMSYIMSYCVLGIMVILEDAHTHTYYQLNVL